MTILEGWSEAEVEFRTPVDLGAGGPVERAEAVKVRITGGWVHLDVTTDPDARSVEIYSVPADRVAWVHWTATREAVQAGAEAHRGGLLGPHT